MHSSLRACSKERPGKFSPPAHQCHRIHPSETITADCRSCTMGDDEALDTPASTLEELLSIDLLSATLESLSARGECKPARTWHAHTPATHTHLPRTHTYHAHRHAPGTRTWHGAGMGLAHTCGTARTPRNTQMLPGGPSHRLGVVSRSVRCRRSVGRTVGCRNVRTTHPPPAAAVHRPGRR